MSAPWMKWYPSDWRSDPRLRSCSLAARGLWAEMICLMHEAEPYGSLLINGLPVSEKQLASLVGASLRDVRSCIAELEAAGVFSKDGEVVFSRRMKRDHEKAQRDKANGKGGGNPRLKDGVNPQDKAQKLEAREPEKKDGANAPPIDPDADLFRRGKEVLGADAGSLIARLKKAKGGSIPHTRAVIEQASTKQNPREYVGRVLAGPNGAVPLTPSGNLWPEGIT